MSQLHEEEIVGTVDEQPAPPAPQKVGLLNSARLNYYLGRVVVALTALAVAIPAALIVVTDADWTTVAGVLGGAALLIPVVVKFLEGVQQHEAAQYQLELTGMKAEQQLRIIAAEEEAAAAIGGSAKQPRVAVPGR